MDYGHGDGVGLAENPLAAWSAPGLLDVDVT